MSNLPRQPAIGDRVRFYPSNGESRASVLAIVDKIWGASCVNVICDDDLVATSVFYRADHAAPRPLGYYCEPASWTEQPAPASEQALEAEIQAAGLNAPRLTPAQIDATIVGEAYHVFPGTTVTVCCLTLRNGFNVTGESAAVSAANFDQGIGRKIARDNARDKIWAFEGYLLKQRLHDAG